MQACRPALCQPEVQFKVEDCFPGKRVHSKTYYQHGHFLYLMQHT
jgi:hypothetical protein